MAHISSTSKPIGLSDQYLILLSGVLVGNAMIGKGFAYLGLPPLFIGEIALCAGLIVVLRTGCLVAALATLPSLVLAATMTWVLLRTLPYVGVYGFDALRDSVVIMYGGFAVVVIALLLEDGRRINTILRYYGAFLNIYIPAIPLVFAFSRYMADHIPRWPGYNVPFLQVGSGEVAVHLAGAVVFVLVGFRKATPLGIICVLATLPMVIASSRGAMLAVVLPVIFATLVLGKVHELAAAIVVGLLIFVAAYTVESAIYRREPLPDSARQLSTRQIVANVESIIGSSDQKLESTKTWRLEWWDIIMKDTVFGSSFWTGRGFGLNLADVNGFQDRSDPNSPPLRSPHNVHMTFLARAGVPGAALWLLFLAGWLGMLTKAMLAARRRRQLEWVGLFLFTICYVMSVVINATFDVALEGPMQGIWFWCLVGFGIGSVMIYRYQTSFISQEQVVPRKLMP
jgi:hypothetical protein